MIQIKCPVIRIKSQFRPFPGRKDALQTAAEGLKQSVQRQQLRTAKPFEVLQAQQFYLQAQNDYADVLAAYNKAQYQLYVAKGNDL